MLLLTGSSPGDVALIVVVFTFIKEMKNFLSLEVRSRRKINSQELFSYGCGKCELPNNLLFKKKRFYIFAHTFFYTICIQIMHITYRLSL